MTTIDKVRTKIHDRDDPRHFSDSEIAVFLDLEGDSVLLAAAAALEAWAASEAATVDSERIGDYSYTSKSVSNKLELAKRYRQQAAEETATADLAPAFGWAALNLTDTSEESLE